jgi:hypothetical protein
MSVHRLVAMAFLGLKPEQIVNHKDGNKQHNHDTNLEATTPSQNNHHAVALGMMASGVRHYRAKLTAEQVQEARNRHRAGGISTAQLAREYGLCHGPMRSVLQGRTYKNVL